MPATDHGDQMPEKSKAIIPIDPLEIIATLREGLLVLTEDLVVEYASDRFLETFEVDRDATIGRPLADLGNGQWNIAALLDPLGQIVERNTTLEDYEVDHVFDHIGRRVMRLNARKTVRKGNGSKRILLAIEDVTEAADLGRELDRQRRLAQGIVDTLREPLLVLDGDLQVVAASRAFYTKFEVEADETIGKRLWDLQNGQWAAAELVHLLTNVISEHNTVEDYEIRHRFSAIGDRSILLNGRKIYRKGNNTKTLLLAMEDVTERRRLEAEREAALDRSNRLLDELNHRVMNSLSMIGSVVAMEARSLSDEDARQAFERVRGRIKSIGALYQSLTSSTFVDTVDADVYLSGIMRDAVDAAAAQGAAIDLDLSVAPVPLAPRTAVPLGLIVNELTTNSLKYAYKGRDGGKLGLEVLTAPNGIEVTVWDDGPGIDTHARIDSGLGQKLVEAFVTQLNGEMNQQSGPEGTRHVLWFPVG